MKNEKFKFYFPSEPLKNEDFAPIESLILKDYYRNAFLKIIDKVSINKINDLLFHIFMIDEFQEFQFLQINHKIFYRLLLLWSA